MKPLGLSANALALALGVPVTRVSDIAREHRGVTADTALRLSRYFGTSPEFWMNLQQAHDLSKVAVQSGPEIERMVEPMAAQVR